MARTRRWTRWAAATVGFLLAASLAQFLLAVAPPDFTSTATTPRERGLPFEEVRFSTADGLSLAAWFIPAESPANATIVVGHGYPAHKGHALGGALFLRARYNLLLFDHRSFGESEGWFTTVGGREAEDVRAAVRYLKARPDAGDVARVVGGLGHSLSGATFLLAHDAGFDALVAESAFARLDRVLETRYSVAGVTLWPLVWSNTMWAELLFGLDPADVSPARAVRDARIPILVIHGSDDATIPVSHAREIAEAAPPDRVELWIIEGGGHGGLRALVLGAWEARVLAFFENAFARGAAAPAAAPAAEATALTGR